LIDVAVEAREELVATAWRDCERLLKTLNSILDLVVPFSGESREQMDRRRSDRGPDSKPDRAEFLSRNRCAVLVGCWGATEQKTGLSKFQATSSRTSAGFLNGRNSPRVTASGTEKASVATEQIDMLEY